MARTKAPKVARLLKKRDLEGLIQAPSYDDSTNSALVKEAAAVRSAAAAALETVGNIDAVAPLKKAVDKAILRISVQADLRKENAERIAKEGKPIVNPLETDVLNAPSSQLFFWHRTALIRCYSGEGTAHAKALRALGEPKSPEVKRLLAELQGIDESMAAKARSAIEATVQRPH